MAIGEGSASTNQARHAHVAGGTTVGFFTDPTVCIGCKACEVACKEWNHVPAEPATWTGTSYDHTGALGASTWRHVKFLEVGSQLSWAGGGTNRALPFAIARCDGISERIIGVPAANHSLAAFG